MTTTFKEYPHINTGWVHTDRYGEIKLVSIDKTSDGFLIGTAKDRAGEWVFNLFLGRG